MSVRINKAKELLASIKEAGCEYHINKDGLLEFTSTAGLTGKHLQVR